ncbi:hypothetical protein ACUXG4_000844 [Cupriavidus metallidurans]
MFRPPFHHRPPLYQRVGAVVSRFDLVGDDVGERQLRQTK